jgi:hypothetical protein
MRQKGNQYAKRVKILKYVKSGAKWRFANIVEHNGKIIRDHVLIAGQDEHHREGTYYIEWYEIENHRHRQSVPDFADLLDAVRRKAIEIEAMRAGVIRADTNPTAQPSTAISTGSTTTGRIAPIAATATLSGICYESPAPRCMSVKPSETTF